MMMMMMMTMIEQFNAVQVAVCKLVQHFLGKVASRHTHVIREPIEVALVTEPVSVSHVHNEHSLHERIAHRLALLRASQRE